MRERLLVWVLALGSYACSAPPRGPRLIELRELSPRRLEAGDRLRLAGSGFPDGRTAEVTLRGELLRAGEAAVSDVAITAQAELISPHGVELALSPELVRELCGKLDARHTTFRGDVAVSFPARTAKGSPVEGVLEGVVFDVTPDTTSKATLSALEREGLRFANFLGVKFQRTDVGLRVSEVAEQSRASRAGLLPGDRLSELDGRIVRELRDWVPAPNTRVAALHVERGGAREVLHVEALGFRYPSPSVLSTAVLMLGIVLGPLLCWWSAFGRGLAFLERKAQGRLRFAPSLRVASSLPRFRELLSALLDRLPASVPPYLGLLATSALFTALSLGKTLVGSDLDLFLVPIAVSAGLVAAAFASGGGTPRWSLDVGARRALGALTVTLPPLLALFTRAAAEDTHELRRLVLTQGAWPWQWAAFSSPVGLLAAVCALGALVPSVGPVVSRGEPGSTRLLELTEWGHKLVLVGALAVTYFGGWRLPGSPDSVLGEALGALSLLVKSWALLGGVVFVRWALGSIDVVVNPMGVFQRLALPSALCVLLALGWRAVISNPAFAPLELASGKVLFTLCLGLVLLMIQRVSSGLRREAPALGVQFWL